VTKRLVIGLDPSSQKIAMMVRPNPKSKPEMVTLPFAKGADITYVCLRAFRFVRAFVKKWIDLGYEVHIFIEEPVVGRGGAYTTIRQAKANGAMLAGARSGGAHVEGVNNSTWKKSVCGKGNAGKPEIKNWVRDHWPYAYDLCRGDQDLLDAACILLYGEKRLELADRLETIDDEVQTTRRRQVRRA
jgi:Holliday junction resolvasome RuvABC endonuclease subunit